MLNLLTEAYTSLLIRVGGVSISINPKPEKRNRRKKVLYRS